MKKTHIVSVSIEGELLRRFDGWRAAKGFRSRSGGLQHLIREELDALSLADDRGPAVATVTFVYDHHRRELQERLTHLQHDHLDAVVASTHVHLDHARCLEVLILRGPAREIRALGERIVATRGIERGEVVLTSAAPSGPEPAHGQRGPGWHQAAHEQHDHGHDHEHGHAHAAPRRARSRKRTRS